MRRADQAHMPPLPRLPRLEQPGQWERGIWTPVTREGRARHGGGDWRGRWAPGLVIVALAILVTPSTIPAYPLVRQGRAVAPFQRGTGGHGSGTARPTQPAIPTIPSTSRARTARTPAPAPSSTPGPSATPMPAPGTNLTANLRMGCTVGPPPVQPDVVFDGANTTLHAPPPQEVALTFDDGPTPYSTPPILSYLEQTHTPATFMVEGQYVYLWPYLVQREWQDGFAVGVHTWDHPDMTMLSSAQRQLQVDSTLQALHAALGHNACIWFWRPPYGAYNSAVVHTAANSGLSTIVWDVDPQDWSRPGTSVIVSRVLAQVHAGSIILLHDGPALRDQTRAALPGILAGLRARGLVPVTLPKLLEDGGYLRHP